MVAKRRDEIDLFIRIISAFEALAQRYKDLDQNATDGGNFFSIHKIESEWLSMDDLASKPN